MAKILIVDDVEIITNLIEHVVCDFGECDKTYRGDDALKIFGEAQEAKKPYDAVFLDYNLPGIRGDDLIVLLKNLEIEAGDHRAAFFFISADPALSDNRKVQLSKPRQIIKKPFRAEEIVAAMHDAGFLRMVGKPEG